MIGSPLVNIVHDRLLVAGYRSVFTPFTVAGVEFPFTAAMRGQAGRALDIVILVDTTTGDFGDRDGSRVQQRVEALSRALDVTGSRFVVTVILVGAVLAEGIDALSETCRVLHIEGIALNSHSEPVDEMAKRQIDDRIRVLLPLTLPISVSAMQDSGGTVLDQLINALPANMNNALVAAVIAASNSGVEAVTEAAALIINSAFKSEVGGEQL